MSALVHLGTIKLRGGTAGDEWTPLDRAFLNQWLAADSEDDSEDDIGDHSEDDAEDDGEDGGEHDAKADAENDAEDDSEKEEDGEDDMDEKDIAAADTLAWCLEDSTLGVTAECSRRGDSVLIRVAVLANDAGHWRMTAARTHLIRELFALLDKSWDGGGGKVLVDVCTHRVLAILTVPRMNCLV
jgi:hypothetical protein